MASSPPPPTPDPWCTAERHGASRYSRGCRCLIAYNAHKKSDYRWRQRSALFGGRTTVDPTGTLRRLRALSAAGWTWKLLTAELGAGYSAHDLLRSHRTRRETAARVAEMYERLEQQPGPSRRAAGHARSKGWAPPECWFGIDMDDPAAVPVAIKYFDGVDEVAVERLRYGHLRSAHDADFEAVFTLMRYERGLSPRVAAELVGVDEVVALRYWRRMDRAEVRRRSVVRVPLDMEGGTADGLVQGR